MITSLRTLPVTLLATAMMLAAPPSRADVSGPYGPDANTLHLWHFDQPDPGPATPDAGVTGSFDLTPADGAVLGAESFPGFGTAGDTSAAMAAGFRGASIPVSAVTGADGAFTFEAIIRPADITSNQQIVSMDNGGANSGRPFQFRIDNGQLRFINIGGSAIEQILTLIPTTGPDAFVAGEWFHAAVTYNGNENTADNIKLYWTRMDPATTVANEILSTTMVEDLTGTAPFGVGNEYRGTQDNNLVGRIDDVRISDVARAPDDFIFFDPNETVPPQLVDTNPAADATDVPVGSSLAAVFDEPVRAGSGGFITLKRTSDDSVVEAFDVATSPQLAFSGTTVTIDPTDDLVGGVKYHVLIDENAIEDLSGNGFAGIADPEAWSFTADGTPPASDSMSPMPGATEVSALAPLTLAFSEPVQAGAGTITIHLASDGSVVQSIEAASGAVVINGADVTIVMDQLSGATAYYVNVSPEAFTDFSGNAYPGISDTSWAFTTATIPEGLLFSHEFGGDASDLDGTTPDVGTGDAIWVASANFNQDGTTDDGPGSATLAFTPFNGLVYTLEASYSGLSANPDDTDWFAVGFVNGQSTTSTTNDRFITGNVVGTAWMMHRGDFTATTNQSFLGNGRLGGGNNGLGPSGVNNGVNWSLSPPEDAVDLRIVLDTTGGPGAWTATWYAKHPADATYTEVRPTELLHDPTTIGAVGIARSNPGVSGTIESFRLYTGAPPSGASLVLRIMPGGGTLDFEWNSLDGMQYDLLSSTDLSNPVDTWGLYNDGVNTYENIPSAGTTTTLSGVIPLGPQRFFALVEEPVPPLFGENFDSAAALPDGWVSSGPSNGTEWQVGLPSGVASGPAAASSIPNCAGTNISGYYTENADVSLVSPSIAIPAGSGAVLSFRQLIDTDLAGSPHDLGSVRILDADNADTPIAGLGIPAIEGDGSEGWKANGLELAAGDVGGRNIKIEFRFVSNAGSIPNVDVWGGFYIDDVLVTEVAP